MCPLLSSKARPGRLTLSVSSLSRRKYLLDQGYLIKRTKNSIPDCISFHIYGSGQDRQNGLLNSHMIPTRNIKNIVENCVLEISWPLDDLTVAGWVRIAMRESEIVARSGWYWDESWAVTHWTPQLISVSRSGPVSNDNVSVWDVRV